MLPQGAEPEANYDRYAREYVTRRYASGAQQQVTGNNPKSTRKLLDSRRQRW